MKPTPFFNSTQLFQRSEQSNNITLQAKAVGSQFPFREYKIPPTLKMPVSYSKVAVRPGVGPEITE